MRSRTLALSMLGPAVAIALLAGSAAPAQDPPKPASAPSRTDRVLEVIRRLPSRVNQLASTPLLESKNDFGCTVLAPGPRGMCGTGWRQAFDPALARSIGRELFAIYGLTAIADAPAPGVATRLDTLAEGPRIGLKLRGLVEHREVAGPGSSWPVVVPEPGATDLDLGEYRALLAAGFRIHTADVESFWMAASQDTFTTTLGYAASVVRFLNEVTDGEDVDLAACTAARSVWIGIAAPRAAPGYSVRQGTGVVRLDVTRPTAVRIEVDPRRAEVASGPMADDPKTRPIAPRAPVRAPLANRGRPTFVQLLGYGADKDTACRFVLRQRLAGGAGAAGAEQELAASDGPLLVVRGTFAAERPFVLELRLQPGSHWLGERVWLAAAER
jgi:hypothetical protein